MPPENNSNKRKRIVLSVENKLKILERLQNGENVGILANEYGIGRQTVRDIQRNKDKLLNFISSSSNFATSSKRKSLKKSNFEYLDSVLYEWYKQKVANDELVSGPLIAEKARWFHQQLGIEEPFQASQGWLACFKGRHGVCLSETQSAKSNEDISAINLHKPKFVRTVESSGLTPEQINIYETDSLCWKELALAGNTSAFQGEHSTHRFKSNNECISNAPSSTVTLKEAMNCAETLLQFLKQKEEPDYTDVLSVQKICMSIREEMSNAQQTHITDYFYKVLKKGHATKSRTYFSLIQC